MNAALEVRQLFSAVSERLSGGVGFLVPAESGGCGGEEGDFLKEIVHEAKCIGQMTARRWRWNGS